MQDRDATPTLGGHGQADVQVGASFALARKARARARTSRSVTVRPGAAPGGSGGAPWPARFIRISRVTAKCGMSRQDWRRPQRRRPVSLRGGRFGVAGRLRLLLRLLVRRWCRRGRDGPDWRRRGRAGRRDGSGRRNPSRRPAGRCRRRRPAAGPIAGSAGAAVASVEPVAASAARRRARGSADAAARSLPPRRRHLPGWPRTPPRRPGQSPATTRPPSPADLG